MRHHGRTIEAQWRTQKHTQSPTQTRIERRTSPVGNFLNYLWSFVWTR